MERLKKGKLRAYAFSLLAFVLAISIAFPAGALAAEEGGSFWDDPLGSIASVFGLEKERTATSDNILNAGAVGDPTTTDLWENYISASTEQTGLIWTDKSITADDTATMDGAVVTKTAGSDFMVTLSALSSVLDTTSTIATQEPLDIVLVLDTSGSMDFTMSGGTAEETELYNPIYTLDTGKTYYVNVGGEYREVTYDGEAWSYGYSSWFRTEVTPKTSASDADSNHVQFYELQTVTASNRMAALEVSIDNFLNQVNANNANMGDEKHRVALIKFASNSTDTIGNSTDRQGYNRSQVVSDFTTDTAYLSQEMHAINPAGATQADYGMNHAQRVIEGDSAHDLSGARANAKKVVIFFTDGRPTSRTDFENSVANGAVQTAKNLKDQGVIIYSVGIFEGADPSVPDRNTTKENNFMNAVSSNYPQATSYSSLGERAADAAFYKTAATADELNKLFDEIFSDISASSGLPTEVEQGTTAATSGYITFTDPLGQYMTVTGVNGLIYEGVKYDQIEATTDPSTNITTYVFKGEVGGEDKHPLMKLENIIMEVQAPTDGSNVGDVVTVKIPAANIPLRHFSVTTDAENKTVMTACDMTPLRISYSVGLRDGALEDLLAPDAAMNEYMEQNSQAGRVNFYSNDFNRENKGALTTSTYVPSKTNPYYYFVRNAALYVQSGNDYALAQGPLDLNETYYYDYKYYELDEYATNVNGVLSSEVTVKSKMMPISGDALKADAPFITENESGNLYVKAGCPKNARVGNTVLSKSDNITSSSNTLLAYQWAGQGIVTVDHGNNGLTQRAPLGDIVLTKTVESTQGLTAPEGTFEFTIKLADKTSDPLKGEFRTKITNATTGAVQNSSIRFNEEGIGVLTLKDGDTVKIAQLPVGINYTVTETAVDGFTTSILDESGTDTADGKGTITPGVNTIAFTNTYSPYVVHGDTDLTGTKTLNGRDWKSGETFNFTLTPDSATIEAMRAGSVSVAGADENTKISTASVASSGDTANQAGVAYGFNFGDIVINKPGTYGFTVAEQATENVNGMTYDNEVYTLTLHVERTNGDWNVTKTWTNALGEEVQSRAFVNEYTSEGTAAITLQKDLLGRNWGQDESYTFKIEPAVPGADIPMPEPNTVTVSKPAEGNTAEIAFPAVTYQNKSDGTPLTYSYKVTEVVPDQRDAGVTYDNQPIIVSLTGIDDGEGSIAFRQSASREGTFTNTYNTEITYGAVGGLNIQKTVTGHHVSAGQFNFMIQASDEYTVQKMQAMDPAWASQDYVKTVSVINPAAAGEPTFIPLLSDLKFSTKDTGKALTFTIKEKLPENYVAGSVVDGYTYDTAVYTVTITPTDNMAGAISVETVVTDGADYTETYTSSLGDTTRAIVPFANAYEATGTFTVEAGKTLVGRNLSADEFHFDIKLPNKNAQGEDVILQQASNASATAGVEADIAFEPITITKSQLEELINSGDATYSEDGTHVTLYIDVVENLENSLPGVTPAVSGFKLDVTIVDNNDGTLTCTVNYPEGTTSLAFGNTYKAEQTAISLKGQKVISYAPADARLLLTPSDIGDKFTFTVEAQDGAPLPTDAQGQPVTSVTNDSQGQIDFGKITFESKHMTDAVDNGDVRTKDFTYKITESGSYPGITNDAAQTKTVVITVTDDKQGNLSASVAGGLSFRFDNTYSVKPVTTELAIHKTLVGRDMGNDRFEFALINDAGTTVAQTDENGDATFNITFEKPGTYSYQVKELVPSTPLGGVSYDPTVYTVSATVTDNRQGQLNVAWSVAKDNEEASALQGPLSFNNTYTTQGAINPLIGSKTIDGRDWTEGESFTFTLAPHDDVTEQAVLDGIITLPETTVTLTADAENPKVNGTPYSFAFDEMKVTKPGTYAFAITENTEGASEDLVYDSTTFIATVVVEDVESNGVLTSTVSYSALNDNAASAALVTPQFVNTFKEQPTSVQLDFTKSFTGRTWKDADTFTFRIAAQDPANPMPPAVVATAVKPASGTQAAFGFGPITYTVADLGGAEEKTFAYTVSEVNDGLGGVTYDTSRDVVVTVKHNQHTGLLETNVDVEGSTTFTNVYAAEPKTSSVTDSIALTKTLENRQIQQGEFAFGMYDTAGNLVARGVNDDQGNVQMSAITFTEPETYVYTIKELVPDVAAEGMTYSDTIYTVQAVVTDQLDGTYKVEWSLVDTQDTTMSFTNTFTPDTTNATFTPSVTKQIVNRDWLPTDSFTFVLSANEATPEAPLPDTTQITVTNESGIGQFLFDTIQYDLSDLGEEITGDVEKTFTYDIAEVAGSDATMTYDGETRTYSVAVSYDYETGVLSVSSEFVPADGQNQTEAFVNVYNPGDVVVTAADVAFTKTIFGRAWTDTDAFTFTLTAEQGTPLPEKTSVTVTKPAEGEVATFDFGSFNYSLSDLSDSAVTGDLSKIFTYTVSETVPAEAQNNELNGLTYDAAQRQIQIAVSYDYSSGAFTAELEGITAPEGVDAKAFANTYNSSTTFSGLAIQKTLNGHAMSDSQFGFIVTPMSADAQAWFGNEPIHGAWTAGEDGTTKTTVLFADATFTQEQAGDVMTFTVKEDVPEGYVAGTKVKGYTYDTAVHTVEMNVVDDGQGNLSTTTTVDGEAVQGGIPTIAFVNEYEAATPAGEGFVANAVKVLEGRDLKTGEFTFQMTDAAGNVLQTITNQPNGNIPFEAISYNSSAFAQDIADGKAVKDTEGRLLYTYTVSEVTDNLPGGITSTYGSEKIMVLVTDNNDGTLTATASYAENGLDNQVDFLNTYGTNSAAVTFSGIKLLSLSQPHLALTVQDIAGKFTFTLTGEEGAPMPDVTSTTNGANGEISFGNVNFTLEDLGGEATKTFTYQVTESVTPGMEAQVPGLTIDAAQEFKVVLKDNGEGVLTAEVVSEGMESNEHTPFVFTNTYTVEEKESSPTGEGNLKAHKYLMNRELKADEFTFALADANGNVIETVGNEADGSINFSTIAFNDPGTYRYTISEVIPTKKAADAGMTYDTTSYEIEAVVTDNLDQTLSVVWSSLVDTSSLDFTNEFTPEKVILDGSDAESGLSFTKEVVGRDWLDDETFTFHMYDYAAPMSADPMDDSFYNKIIVEKPASGNVATFSAGTLVFTAEDLGVDGELTEDVEVTKTYALIEEPGTAGGMTYDESLRIIEVRLSYDYSEGLLSARVVNVENHDSDADPYVFVNTYKTEQVTSSPTGEGNLTVTKQLKGRSLEEGEFSFILKNKAGEEVGKATNKADGTVSFGSLIFKEPGTYSYTLEEVVHKEIKDVDFDKTTYKVQAVVTDNLDGTLHVEWTVKGGDKDVTFVNTYTPEITPDTPQMPKTNDTPLAGLLMSIMSICAGVAVIATTRMKRSRR